MSREFLDILNEVYPRYLPLPPEWTAQEQHQYLVQESERLSRMVGELADQLSEQSVTQWIRSHGHHPDYLTKVGLLNNARMTAREQILNNEVYEQIPVSGDETDEDLDVTREEPPQARDGVPWDRRWTEPDWRSDPSAEMETVRSGRNRGFRCCSGSRRAICWPRVRRTDCRTRPPATRRWRRNWRRWCIRICAATAFRSVNRPVVPVRPGDRSSHRSPPDRPRRRPASPRRS